LAQFWHYAVKVFDLGRRLRRVREGRQDPDIPAWAVSLSLFLGALLRVRSYHQLQQETQRRGWQRLIRWPQPIDHEVFNYVAERYHLEDWRELLAATAKQFKRNKALERCKIGGLLFVSLDANEQFKSRHRCCPQCRQRRVKIADGHGGLTEVAEYYHYQVYAQINGPDFHLFLDLETVQPGEEEAGAALRLLGRLRRLYGVRFFDAITVDAWYVKGPFLRAVEQLGWGVVSVLKQETMEIYQETQALSRNQRPVAQQQEGGRRIQLWEVRDLRFSDEYPQAVRVVRSEEQWTQVERIAGQNRRVPRQSHWLWVATPRLDPYGPWVIHQAGHRRWGIENNGFNELTQYCHLEHCPHHEPRAILAWLLIVLLAFNLFHAFASLQSKLCRAGHLTRLALARELDLALEADAWWEQILWSG